MSSPAPDTLPSVATRSDPLGRSPRNRRRLRPLAVTLGTALACASALLGSVLLGSVLLGAPGAGAATVRVRAGQNLTQIARTYGTTVGALVAANGIPNPNLVVEGAVLTIPTASAAGASGAGTPSPAPTASIGSTDAVAAPGDSLWSIATRNGTTVSALARANGIPVTATILVGERLALPAPTAGGSALGSSPGLPAALLASPGRLALIPLFQQWAAHFGLPVALLEGTCWWESGWQSGVTSATGAVGIGQLEPSTVVTFRSILGDPALSAYEPSDNIEMTAAYLHQLLVQMGGSQSQALAAYYQGPASLSSVGELPSTAQYVQGVLATATLFG